MKNYYLLTKTLLMAVMLLGGANFAWATLTVIKTYDFYTASANAAEETGVPYLATTTKIGVDCNHLTGIWDGVALQGADKWSLNRGGAHSYEGLYNYNGGGRVFGLLGLKAGDIVTINANGGLATTATNGTYDSENSTSTSAVFTVVSDGNFGLYLTRYYQITTVTVQRDVTCADPTYTITGASGTSRKFTLSCATDGATIYYSETEKAAGAAGWTEYSDEVTTSATTIWAYANKGGNSDVISFATGAGSTVTLNAPSLSLVDFTKSGSDYYPKYTFSSDQISVVGNPSVTYTYTIDGTPSAGNVTEYAEAKAGTLIVSANAAGYTSATTEVDVYKYSQTIGYDFSDAEFALNSNWTLENEDAAMKGGTYVDGEGNTIKGKRYQPADNKVNEDGYLFDNVAFSYNDKSLYYYVAGLGLGYEGGSGHNTTTITVSGLTANSYTIYKKQLSGNPQSFSTSVVAGNNTFTMGKYSGTGAHVLQGIYVYNSADKDVVDAIADCKSHETSAAFATAIDEESFATAAEVYAFHTAWQIAQADAASSNDITKVIFDAGVSDFSRWNDARSNSGQQYTGAPDNKYFDGWDKDASNAKQKIYGLPAGTYTIKVATRASETLTEKNDYNVWVSGGSADASVLGNHIGSTGGVLGNGWNWTILSFTLSAKADVEIGFYTLPGKDTGLWAGCDDWHLYKGTLSVSGTITPAGWSTFTSVYPLDLSTVTATSGATAYYASAADGSTVTLTPTGDVTVPIGEGLMIKGTPGETFTINATASGTAISGNKLIGQTTTGDVDASNKDSNGKYHYVFGYVTETPSTYGFYNLASDTSVPAGKAYLETTTALTLPGAARLTIVFDDETTGIQNLTPALSEGEGVVVYNLRGQRVAQPQKGLYIVNGKKVVIK